jgi:drug/metabolite transporter (DMT)-like permease
LPIGVVLLVLFSALIHASWNAVLKRTREPDQAVFAITVVAAATSLAASLVMGATLPPARSLAWIAASGVLEAGYFLARALTLAPLGPVYTIVRGGALVIVWPLSVALLGEELTLARAVGSALILLGLVSTGASEHVRGSKALRPVGPISRGILIAVVAACFVGGYNVAFKIALNEGSRPEIVVGFSLTVAVLVNASALGRARLQGALAATRLQPVHVIGGGVLTAAGFIVYLVAMDHLGAGLVLTLRNTSILFAQLIAFALGDRLHGLGVAGALLVFFGAALLAV